jgi:Ca2+/Na+ antiporter
MKSLSRKAKLRIFFYIGFAIIIYLSVVYGREWYHILLLLLYLAFIMFYLIVYLKERREKEYPRCAKRVKVDAKICRFCYYEFPPKTLSLEKTSGLGVHPLMSLVIGVIQGLNFGVLKSRGRCSQFALFVKGKPWGSRVVN